MTDEQVADALIERLNRLIENPAVRKDISVLMQTRTACSTATAEHPTIQASSRDGQDSFSPLGLLNGIAGAIPEGKFKGWGYITAVLETEGEQAGTIVSFQRTETTNYP